MALPQRLLSVPALPAPFRPSLPVVNLSLPVANNIVPFRRPPAATIPRLSGLGLLGRAVSVWGTVTAIADLVETFVAPRWFQWLESTTGFRFFGSGERVPSFSPGTHQLRARGKILANLLVEPWTGEWVPITYTLNDSQTVSLTFSSRVELIGFRVSDRLFPLSGGEGELYGGDHRVALVFSDAQEAEFDFFPRIAPWQLGPFYSTYRARVSFDLTLWSDKAPAEQKYEPAAPRKATPKPAADKRGLVAPIASLPEFFPTVPSEFPRLPSPKPPAPAKVRKEREGLISKPTSISKIPDFLLPPEAAPEFKPLVDLLVRFLQKECPPPCPPPPRPSALQLELPKVTLAWVEEMGSECSLVFKEVQAAISAAEAEKIRQTAAKAYKLWGVEPVLAASPEEEAPWSPPFGPHLKVIWVPITRVRGYYYFRVPHWGLGLRESLALDWSSLRWEKGLRNELLIRFQDGKRLRLLGHSLPNLEAIWEFVRQGLSLPVGFEVAKTERGESLTPLTLKVRKLEFWMGRSGRPLWWSWWPPL